MVQGCQAPRQRAGGRNAAGTAVPRPSSPGAAGRGWGRARHPLAARCRERLAPARLCRKMSFAGRIWVAAGPACPSPGAGCRNTALPGAGCRDASLPLATRGSVCHLHGSADGHRDGSGIPWEMGKPGFLTSQGKQTFPCPLHHIAPHTDARMRHKYLTLPINYLLIINLI